MLTQLNVKDELEEYGAKGDELNSYMYRKKLFQKQSRNDIVGNCLLDVFKEKQWYNKNTWICTWMITEVIHGQRSDKRQ